MNSFWPRALTYTMPSRIPTDNPSRTTCPNYSLFRCTPHHHGYIRKLLAKRGSNVPLRPAPSEEEDASEHFLVDRTPLSNSLSGKEECISATRIQRLFFCQTHSCAPCHALWRWNRVDTQAYQYRRVLIHLHSKFATKGRTVPYCTVLYY